MLFDQLSFLRVLVALRSVIILDKYRRMSRFNRSLTYSEILKTISDTYTDICDADINIARIIRQLYQCNNLLIVYDITQQSFFIYNMVYLYS